MPNPSTARPISGNQGYVTITGGSASGIAEVTEFNGTLDLGVKTWFGQNSVQLNQAGQAVAFQKTALGNQKCSGTITGLFDPNFPLGASLAYGALVTLTLYLNYPNASISFQARIATRTFGANINTGDIQPFTATFESDGFITVTGI